MQQSCSIILSILFLLTCIGAASISAETLVTSFDSDHHGIPTTRFLRVLKHVANVEERAVGTTAAESLLKTTAAGQRIEALLQKATSTDQAFKLLKLHKAKNGIFDSAELKAWITFMKTFNRQNPTKKTTLVATLTAHYGDEGLAKMVGAAKLVPSTAKFATRLEAEQAQRWLALGKTPDDVFELIKLHKAGSSLFDKPKLSVWVKFVDEYNKENPTQKTTLISRLSQQYSEKSLTNMLIAAEKNPSAKSIATRIQAEQTRRWLTTKTTPEDLFKLLQLNKAKETLFENPLFAAWIHYADDFRVVHSDTNLATISTLMKYYNDETLARMIMAAEKVERTQKLAGRLQSEQFRYWLLKQENPNDVYNLLKLANTKGNLFESPLYTVWAKYLDYYSSMNLTKRKWDLIKLLTNRFGDEGLSDMLTAAVKVPSTKEMATELQTKQIKGWLNGGKRTKEVYRLLRVEGTAANDPNRLLYNKYVADFKEAFSW